MRVAYEEMVREFARVLEKKGFAAQDAADAADIFAQNSLAGVYSHGLNRFPRIVRYLDKGEIDPRARATCELRSGVLERWDGHRCFGPLNARRAMERACVLAKENGVGLVALGNNNHWLRGGSYGWQAADAGCIVDNVDTIVAIYHAVKLGRPLMHRIVTITGDAIVDPRNFYVCIGTNYAELVEAAGGFKTQPKKVISGGPMMGFAMFGLDVPTTKTTSALLCLTEDAVEDASQNATACINCGRCVEACPSRIVPSRLADFAENHLEEPFEQWHGMECVECGSCSFTCPAKRNLAQSIKSMRKTILANRRKK